MAMVTKFTLCWDCQRAVEKSCRWSKSFKPVPGWDAEEHKMKDVPGSTYCVKECPMFVRDAYNHGLKRMEATHA